MIEIIDKPQIELTPINIPMSSITSESLTGVSRSIGYHPLVYYNGTIILADNIAKMELNCDNFIPELHIFFKDKTEIMRNETFAMDNTLISIYIDSRTKDVGTNPALRPIRIDFKISDFSYLEEEDLHYVQGVMSVDGLYLSEIKAYPSMTSYDVVRDVARNVGAGFSSNIKSTKDKMTWLNTDLRRFVFVQELANKAYASEKSFFYSFLDFYYNLNFIDIETQMKDNIEEQYGIMTLATAGALDDSAQQVGNLFLVNDGYLSTGYNNTFSSYTVMNQSLKTSLRNGYRTELYYYDKMGNWEQRAGTFVKFVLESNTDGVGIILKSIPSDNKPNGFYKNNTRKVYESPVDTDNMHEHYSYAVWLNEMNLDEIQKLKMTVSLTHPNFNFYKYQKIKVLIMDTKPSSPSGGMINKRLSGGWLITSIRFIYTEDDGLIQELDMIKRELTDKNFSI